MRVLIKALLVLSLLWSAVAPAVAAAMGCCEADTPCCMAPGTVRGCTVCPPAALHLGATHRPLGEVARFDAPPAVVAFPLNQRLDDIWRPPMGRA